MALASTAPVLKLRRSRERGYEDFGWTDNWMTFAFGGYYDPKWVRFGPLRVIVENHIQPHTGFQSHSHRDVEIVTYVAAGTLTHTDSFGHSAGVTRGEMQHISAGPGMVHSEENLQDEVEHNLQIWLVPGRRGTLFAYHQLLFTPEERRGRFRLYCSPDGRDASMPMHCDVCISAGLFSPGDQAEHALDAGRGAWVQMVHGRLRVAGVTLEEGDGLGITHADRLAFDFDAESEVLLLDLRMDAPLIWT
ncbi:MAG: pirin family protein [Acidobacteriia bacterium]|nr:pirin family protein [Terriglobia bacterium]